jgi:hypothetical protein
MTIVNPFTGDVVEMDLAHMNKDRVGRSPRRLSVRVPAFA